MLDTVIRGDKVVTPWGTGRYDIGIKGEKIVAVQSPGTITGDIGRVIDATGKVVIPGGIEPHAHSVPEYYKDVAAGLDQITRACVWGGTTTLCDFAVQYPGTDIIQSIEEQKKKHQGNAYSDYAYHCMLMGNPSPKVISQIGEVIKAGFPCMKLFTTNVRPPTSPTTSHLIGMGHISAIMEQAAAHGGIVMVHAEDDDIVMYNYERLLAENRTKWYNMHLAHSSMSEDVSSQRVIRVAKWTGAAVYLVHVSAREVVCNIQEARGKGQPVYGETLHNYVTFTVEDCKKQPDGMKYQTYPSLKFDEDKKALWEGLINGSMSCMATDEIALPYKVKTRGKTIFDVVGGHLGTEARVGITYTEGVVKRGMSLQRFVEVVSTNAAKIMGLYPRKGAIAPGSDADIVFIDPEFRKRLTLDDLHCLDYSIWEGWEVSGWPVFTMLRGKVIVEGGKLVGTKGYGHLITERKIDPEVLKRPVC